MENIKEKILALLDSDYQDTGIELAIHQLSHSEKKQLVEDYIQLIFNKPVEFTANYKGRTGRLKLNIRNLGYIAYSEDICSESYTDPDGVIDSLYNFSSVTIKTTIYTGVSFIKYTKRKEHCVEYMFKCFIDKLKMFFHIKLHI